jgi:putative nucleotidyltransferase with HDIG domain
MRLLALERCKPGLELAKTIYDSKGHVLLAKGYKLTDNVIIRLKQYGVFTVFIKDKYTEGLIDDNDIPFQMKQNALNEIKTSMDSFTDKGILSGRLNPDTIKSFQNICNVILEELQSNKKALNLLTSVQIFDNYLYNHSFNVMVYSLQLGLYMGLDRKSLELLGLGALLHDIGKLTVPVELLNKPGKLTLEEFELIKTHTTEGYEFLRKQYDIPIIIAHFAFQHHEKIDGSGYPRGITGKDIHPLAKIMTVADVFDAVTSNRSYRKAMLPHKGLEILYVGAGNHFEFELVENFRRAVIMYPIGVTVTLNNGYVGIVVKNNAGLPERPIIRVVEIEGQRLQDEKVYDVDLKKSLTVEIINCDAIM